MLAIAHRGCAAQYPENTIHAIESAAPHVDAVEVDVRRCGSGELIVFHDADLGGLTGHEGAVGATPWSTIRDLEVGDSGEAVPLFREAVAAWPAGTAMNLDLPEAGVTAEAAGMLGGFDGRVYVSSPVVGALRAVPEPPADVELTTGYSFHADPGAGIGAARDLGCEFVHVHHRLALETDLVERAHDAGLRVDAWTVEDAATVEALRERGVDAVTVDRWDILRG